uniref:Uncharacterized protein n=1 Tax=Trichuris muris TaxID=70415 RepID=A0A5S6QKX9_TRIMR
MKEGSAKEERDQRSQAKGDHHIGTNSPTNTGADKTLAEIAKSKGIPIDSLRKVEFVDVDLPKGVEEVTIPKSFTSDINPGLSKEQVTELNKQLVKDFEKLIQQSDSQFATEKKNKSDSSKSNGSTGSESSFPSADKIAKQLEPKDPPPPRPPKMKKGRYSYFN